METFDHLEPYERDLITELKAGNEENVNDTLEKILFPPSISGIALYEPGGKGIVHLVPPGRVHPGIYCPAAPGMNWSKEPWFVEYEQGGGPLITNMFEPPRAWRPQRRRSVTSL